VGKTLSIEWEKRYRPNSGSAWGSWAGAEGCDNLADLYGSAGQYQYRARNGAGDTWKASSEDPPVTIVEVGKIEINANGSWYDVTEQEIVVLAGTKYMFRALANPSDAAWPASSPQWYGAKSGTGETIEVGFTSSGTKTLTGECCCDAGKKTVTIKVILPEPDEVSFDSAAGCGMENDIYGITDPVWKRENNPDNPASYWQHGCIKIKAKFWASDDLTFGTPNVEIKPVGLGGEEFFTAYVTFGTLWPAPVEAVAHKSVSLLENSIGTTYLVIIYYYRVPWGTNQWTMMAQISGAHKIYRVSGSPELSLDETLYTEANLDICTGWADGCTKVDTSDDSTNIPRKVQLGAKDWFSLYGYEEGTGEQDDPFTYIPANKGDCVTYADLMTKALWVLGVEAENKRLYCRTLDGRNYNPYGNQQWFYTTGKTPHWLNQYGDADGDETLNKFETGYPGTLEGIYVKGSNPDHDAAWRVANGPWNWHASSLCIGHCWEITFGSTPDHDTEGNMCASPNGPFISYPANDFGDPR